MLFSPLQEVPLRIAQQAGVRLFCKRDDLYSPVPGTALQGNKVRKLLPVLDVARAAERSPVLVSFGGAYSNHVCALAVAGKEYGFPVHLIIRGEEVSNAGLQFCADAGAMIERISRVEYRSRHNEQWLTSLKSRLAHRYQRSLTDIFLIPEGGTTEAAVHSCGNLYSEIERALGAPPDYLCLAAGTGGTAAGVIRTAKPSSTIEVYPALKGNWMNTEIARWLPEHHPVKWSCIPGYAFGGYGKFPDSWIRPAPGIAKVADIGQPGLPPLEPVYTAKLFSGVLDRVSQGWYPPGSSIVVVHTGGLY